MPNSKSSLPELLCKVDFPLYGLCCITNRHILLAGGGGAARTGVKNGMEIFELSHNGKGTVAESVTFFDTGIHAIMNIASAQYDPQSQTAIVACGQNENCQLYRLQLGTTRKSSIMGMLIQTPLY